MISVDWRVANKRAVYYCVKNIPIPMTVGRRDPGGHEERVGRADSSGGPGLRLRARARARARGDRPDGGPHRDARPAPGGPDAERLSLRRPRRAAGQLRELPRGAPLLRPELRFAR